MNIYELSGNPQGFKNVMPIKDVMEKCPVETLALFSTSITNTNPMFMLKLVKTQIEKLLKKGLRFEFRIGAHCIEMPENTVVVTAIYLYLEDLDYIFAKYLYPFTEPTQRILDSFEKAKIVDLAFIDSEQWDRSVVFPIENTFQSIKFIVSESVKKIPKFNEDVFYKALNYLLSQSSIDILWEQLGQGLVEKN